VAERLNEFPEVSAFELNISCPNVKEGGIAFGTSPQAAQAVTAAVRRVTKRPLIVKLSPNVTDITAIAQQVEAAGADALSLINTLLGLKIDLRRRRPFLGNLVGGLSGPAIKPVALRMVWQVAQVAKVPVIGIGGIVSAEDAMEFFIAGASAIQVGTANFVNPHVTTDIIDGVEKFLFERNVDRISDLIGTLEI
jgi:dihydroorotate dehydrogenase (NAD+) catalytic subunit